MLRRCTAGIQPYRQLGSLILQNQLQSYAKIASTATDILAKPVCKVKGIGARRTEALESMGIKTIRELLSFAPVRYQDRTNIVNVSDLRRLSLPSLAKGCIAVAGTVASSSYNFKSGVCTVTLTDMRAAPPQSITDESSCDGVAADSNCTLQAMWLRGSHHYRKMQKGSTFVFYGRLMPQNPKSKSSKSEMRRNKQFTIVHPECVQLDNETASLVAALINKAMSTTNKKVLLALQDVEANETEADETVAADDFPFWYPPRSELLNMIGIIPVYRVPSSIDKSVLTSKRLRSAVYDILFADPQTALKDHLPNWLLTELDLPDLTICYRWLHFPPSLRCLARALRRVHLESLLLLQYHIARQQPGTQNELTANASNIDELRLDSDILHSPTSLIQQFVAQLPFQLTAGQHAAFADIARDMCGQKKDSIQFKPMHKLLQGDVGCGKTVVIIMSMLAVIEQGFQAAMVAPTEVLAEQHFHTINGYLQKLNLNIKINVVLLTSAAQPKARKRIRDMLATGEAHIIVGTSSLFQEKVEFARLGLCVIDEQQRFGVAQRMKFASKGYNGTPHTLMSSATPIPRTLALTLFGEVDVITINELPASRKPIKTILLDAHSQRPAIYNKINEQLALGHQVYVVNTVIEDSSCETHAHMMSVEKHVQRLRSVFSQYSVGALHGRMDWEMKDAAMKRFKDNEIHILVCTSVIEVGVDVPNATLIVIENAETFGLSTLHQLRGRVGRGSHQSFCILSYDDPTGKLGAALAAPQPSLLPSLSPSLSPSSTSSRDSMFEQYEVRLLELIRKSSKLSPFTSTEDAHSNKLTEAEKAMECFLERERFMERLQIMAQTNDGFAIAARDLQIRGIGDVMGAQQSGSTRFLHPLILQDISMVTSTKDAAERIYEADPEMQSEELAIFYELYRVFAHQLTEEEGFLGSTR